MTIVIELDAHTEQALQKKAAKAGKRLDEYAADILRNRAQARTGIKGTSETPAREFGFYAGRITMTDDFDAPLPEFDEYR